MSCTGECHEVKLSLGVYVLGAVEPPERRVIDQHLTGCPRCRSELAGLAGLPALLAKVSADEVAGVDALTSSGQSWPSDQALRSQLASAARFRRNRLRAWISVAVIAGAVVGSAAVAAWHARPVRQPVALRLVHHVSTQSPASRSPASRSPATRTKRPGYVTMARVTNPRTRVSATVRYLSRPWGLRLLVSVSGVASGTPCSLDVVDALGRTTTAGGWTVVGDLGTWYPGSSSFSIDDLSGFIVASGGKVLVVIPLREHVQRRGGGTPQQARLSPHGRQSVPAFGVIRPPPRQPAHQGPGSAQLTSHYPAAGRARSSGNATDLALVNFRRPA